MDNMHVDEENLQNNNSNSVKMNHSILDDFKKLMKNKDKLRMKAGSHLVKCLLETKEDETERKYALGRLIRGLGSSTLSTRYGFYSSLVPLLTFTNVTVNEIFDLMNKELHTGKSNSKSENADISTGKILVCAAMIRSDLFIRSTEDDQKKVLQCLMSSGKERSYLLRLSFQILIDLVDKLDETKFNSLVKSFIQLELEKPLSEYNLDTLYLLIMLNTKYPKLVSDILKKSNGKSKLVSQNNIESLANILMNIPKVTAIDHPVYLTFGKILAKTEFVDVLMKQMDKGLVKYNKNKHMVIINFLTLILENIENPNDVPSLLNDNLIKQTLTIFRLFKGNEKDNELKKLTHKMFNAIFETLKRENVKEDTKILVLRKLLFSPGTFIFEKITKSTLVQQISSALRNEGVKKLSSIYREVILLENEEFNSQSYVNFQNNDRLYAAHLLMKLLSHSAMHDENQWKLEQLKFLMHLGLTKQPRIGVELAGSLKDSFYRSLDLKLSKLDDLSDILLQIFNDLDSVLNSGDLESVLRLPVTQDTYATWSRAKELINKIESKKKKKVKLVFQVLFLHLSLQLFNDSKLAKDALDELFSCYQKIKKEKSSEKDNDPAWIEVVVELFLSLLSHSSSLLRKVINCVFPHLCKYLNATAIHQILSVLDPNNKDNPLTNNNDSSDDESDVSDDEKERQDEGENNHEESSEEESNDENEDESGDDHMEETTNEKLRKALHTALMENDDGDQSDIDLDQLEENHGEKLNKILGNVFKQFNPNLGKSKKQNKSDEFLTHFRVRVLDLIEIYLDSSPSMILTLEIMLPLLQILEFSVKDDHQKPLQNRVKSCLKSLSGLKNFEDVSEVTDKTLHDLLQSLLEKGNKSSVIIQFMGEEIAQCCTFIIKCSQNIISKDETPKKIRKHLKQNIMNILKDLLDGFLKRRDCCIPFVLFKQTLQINWEGNIELINLLTNSIFNKDVKPFKRTQALQLAIVFYSNHRLLSSSTYQEKIGSLTKEFLNECQKFFANSVDNHCKTNVKERFISFLFNLIATIKNSPIIFEEFNWEQLAETVREYRSYLKLNQDTKKTFNKLCVTLKVSNVVQMKNSVIKLGNNDEDDNSSITSTAKKNEKTKHKKNKDKLKQKKEAKQERMKSLSEGLEGGFTTLESVAEIEMDESVENNQTTDSITNKQKGMKMVNGISKKNLKKEAKQERMKSLSEDLESSCRKSEEVTEIEMDNSVKNNETINSITNKQKKRKMVNGVSSISKKNKTSE